MGAQGGAATTTPGRARRRRARRGRGASADAAEGDKAIESLLAKLEKGKDALFEVMSQLPSELCEHLDSPEFQLTCYEQFDGLDEDQSGSLTVDELYPVIANLAGAREWAVTDAQCARFAKMFDEDGNGDISKTEFVGLMQFTLAMLHCNRPRGGPRRRLDPHGIAAFATPSARRAAIGNRPSTPRRAASIDGACCPARGWRHVVTRRV